MRHVLHGVSIAIRMREMVVLLINKIMTEFQ